MRSPISIEFAFPPANPEPDGLKQVSVRPLLFKRAIPFIISPTTNILEEISEIIDWLYISVQVLEAATGVHPPKANPAVWLPDALRSSRPEFKVLTEDDLKIYQPK